MNELPPVKTSQGPAALATLPGQVWIEVLRQLRGRRWWTYAVLCVVGAYWFGRTPLFGEGGLAWFPGAENGVAAFTVFFALAAMLMGAHSLGQWYQYRAGRLLEPRLTRPFGFMATRVAATTLVCLPPAALVAFWSPAGAWRAGYVVLWEPNALYLAAAALPVLICGSAAGLLARAIIPRDTPALVLGALLLAPVIAYRLWAAPIQEVFDLASYSMGVLVARKTLVREAGITALAALAFLGGAALLVPSPKARSAFAGQRLLRFDIPYVTLGINKLRLQILQWPLALALLSGAALVVGGGAIARMARVFPMIHAPWEVNIGVEPADTNGGVIPAARIVRRDVVMPQRPEGNVSVSLALRAENEPQRLVLLTFGGTLELAEPPTVASGTVEVVDGVFPSSSDLVTLRFEPPLDAEGREVTLILTPTPAGKRLWERAYHPQFHRFSFLGPWYGETAMADFRFNDVERDGQFSPFRIEASVVEPLSWVCGSAAVTKMGVDRIEIVQPLDGTPARLIAATLVDVGPPEDDFMNVHFLLLPHRERLARNIHRIYGDQLERLRRTLGDPPRPVVVYEVPEEDPADPLAISSALMDQFDAMLPGFQSYEGSTSPAFFAPFPRIHRGIVAEVIQKTFHGFEHPELLNNGMIEYLHRYALGQGLDIRLRTRQDIVLLPYQAVQRGGGYPFDITEAQLPAWQGSMFSEDRPENAPPPDPRRYVAFHHMLRGVVGDSKYHLAMRAMLENHQGQRLTLEKLRNEMEAQHGKQLGWFFDEWVHEGVMPELRILEAQAFLIENPETREISYRAEVTITNAGTGRMPVPWALATEDDDITIHDKQWIGPGEEVRLSVTSVDRPVLFELDPYGWIAQLRRGSREERDNHPRVFFRTVAEL